MKMLHQLIRQPIRTIAFLLMLSLASTFSCLGFGVQLSAQATLKSIESGFVTIALPTNKTEMVEYKLENGSAFHFEQSVITSDMWKYIQELPRSEGPVLRAVEQSYVSAWIPELMSMTSAKEEESYHTGLNKPYDNVLLVLKLTELGEVDTQILPGKIVVSLKAELKDTILIHEDFEPRSHLTLHCTFASEEEYQRADLQVGEQYIVYGQGYIDFDLDLRNNLATMLKLSVNEISWDHISYDVEEYFPDNSEYVAVYDHGDRAVGLKELDLQNIGMAAIYVKNSADSYNSDFYLPDIHGDQSEYTAADLLATPTIAKLNIPLEDFLLQDSNALWQTALEETAIRYQSFPVIGTDYLESMYLFQQMESFIVEGRSFSEKEYTSGGRVCVISEAVAKSSGITIGDTISLSYYWGANPHDELARQGVSNLMAQSYSEKLGFSTQDETYTVIGIYRQSNRWSQSLYSFTPNTIFVPSASISVPTYTDRTGVYYTLVIENGRIDDVKKLLVKKGYPEDTLFFFDNGYSEIAGTLKNFNKSAIQIFVASGVTWIVVLGAYIAFFLFRQQKTAGLLLSLGAGKKKTRQSIILTSMLPVFFASVSGAICSTMLLEQTMTKVFASVEDSFDTAYSGTSVGGHIGVDIAVTTLPETTVYAVCLQILITLVTCSICAYFISQKDPRILIKK